MRLFDIIRDYCRIFVQNNKRKGSLTGDIDDIFKLKTGEVDHHTIDRLANLRMIAKKKLYTELSTICHFETERVRRSAILTWQITISTSTQFPEEFIRKWDLYESSYCSENGGTIKNILSEKGSEQEENIQQSGGSTDKTCEEDAFASTTSTRNSSTRNTSTKRKKKVYDLCCPKTKKMKRDLIERTIQQQLSISKSEFVSIIPDFLQTPVVSKSLENRSDLDSPRSILEPQSLFEITKMRTTFTQKTKNLILSSLQFCRTNDQLDEGINELKNSKRGICTTITPKQIKYWRKAKVKNKRGRKINHQFENDIWYNLMICAIVESTSAANIYVEILHSIAHSYDIIKTTARNLQVTKWSHDPKIQALTFSDGWVNNFLVRAKMRRRKVTRERKSIVPEEEIIRQLMLPQQKIIEGKYLPSQICNIDETGINYGITNTHTYLPSDVSRGLQDLQTDIKARITALPGAFADGDFLPNFFILKHSISSAKKPDQTSMRVIKNLHNSEGTGFTSANGWELRTRSRVLLTKNRKTTKMENKMHSVDYLIYSSSRIVITSQCNTWNDAIRMAMYIDLILKPEGIKRGKLFV